MKSPKATLTPFWQKLNNGRRFNLPTALRSKHFMMGAFILTFAVIGVSLLMLSRAATTPPPTLGSAGAPSGYGLVWSDEFNGTSVDTSKWNLRDNSNYGSGGNEDQCYFARNASEGGGILTITAKHEKVLCGGRNPDGPDNNYYFTSAFLTTVAAQNQPQKFGFKYGYIEARVKMPYTNASWGSFWLVGASGAPGWPDYGEFDIEEVQGVKPDRTTGTFHYACPSKGHCHTSPTSYNLLTKSPYSGSTNDSKQLLPSNFGSYTGEVQKRYVRYGFLWEPNRITWYIDGVPYRSFDGTNVTAYYPDGTSKIEKTVSDLGAPNVPFSTIFGYNHGIHLNLAMGGDAPRNNGYCGNEKSTGGYDDCNLVMGSPTVMQVDYVRVYQKGVVTPASTPTPDTQPPTAPGNLTGNAASATQVNLSWAGSTDDVGVDHYQVVRDGQAVGTTTATNYTDTGMSSGAIHTYLLYAFDQAGNRSNASNQISVNVPASAPPPTSGGSGSGLRGTYFNNTDFTAEALARTDGTINFDWGSGTPNPAVGADTFSARWVGQVQATRGETYTFYTQSDDGVRLWVNGQQLINNWTDHGVTENRGTIALTAGQKYDIRLEYYENGGDAVAKLLWSSPSIAKQVIPASQLYASGYGLSGSYFDHRDLSGTAVQRLDRTVDFDWGRSAPISGVGTDTFGVRWTGKIVPPKTGTYTFYTQSDDGVRLWVNGAQLVNNWTDHGLTENSKTISLTGGQSYDIKMEFYENTGDAVARLLWSGPGVSKEVVRNSALFAN